MYSSGQAMRQTASCVVSFVVPRISLLDSIHLYAQIEPVNWIIGELNPDSSCRTMRLIVVVVVYRRVIF